MNGPGPGPNEAFYTTLYEESCGPSCINNF
jgi:hypothetical protein